MTEQTTLLIPEKADIEFEQVFETWTHKGGIIKRLGKYWIRDEELAKQPIAIYGNQAFSLVLAQVYNVELISPDDALIAKLENKWIKRKIELKEIGEITQADFPLFVKPVIPKLFIAGIFQTLPDFKEVTKGLQDSEQVLVSSVVNNIQAEARSFIMDGAIKDIALYEGSGDLTTGKSFLNDFIDNNKNELPRVVVIDIAYSNDLGWFVLEFNACWGAGLNNCKAENVIDCIVGATINKRR
jgi:hypothetical protein